MIFDDHSLISRPSAPFLAGHALTTRVGIRSGRARFTPLDRLDRLKVGPRIDSDRPDRFKVGNYSKVNRSDRFENEIGPTRVPGSGMKREITFCHLIISI